MCEIILVKYERFHCILMTDYGVDFWTFAPYANSKITHGCSILWLSAFGV
jgi:hypothetical protein